MVVCIISYHDGSVGCLADPVVVLGPTNVELQGSRHMLVSHDRLNHVGRNLIVDQPGSVEMSEIMKPQRLPGRSGHVFNRLCIRVEGRRGRIAGIGSPAGSVAIATIGDGFQLGHGAEQASLDERRSPHS